MKINNATNRSVEIRCGNNEEPEAVFQISPHQNIDIETKDFGIMTISNYAGARGRKKQEKKNE